MAEVIQPSATGTPRWWAHAVLASYGQIFFRGSMGVGLVLLLATFWSPRQGLFGLVAVVVSLALAKLGRLSDEFIHDGLYGYSALLVGLGIGALLEPTSTTWLLLVAASVAVVPITAASHSALWNSFGLPPLTLPFLIVFTLVSGGAQALGVPSRFLATGSALDAMGLPSFLTTYLQSLGAIFFLPRADAGLVVLLGLALYSRVAVLLSLLGFALAVPIADSLLGPFGATLPVVLGYNFLLTAIALGGVWFVPSFSAFVFAAVGVMVCAVLTVGFAPYLARVQAPMLVLPFNLTVLLFLYAMRQRVRDGRPKAVDFLIGTPEENVNYFATRQARFGSTHAARIRAPFLGVWTVTQGIDGDLTHRGAWKDAFDFEVLGADGKAHRGAGRLAQDYLCYRLPVLAPAKGTVARVVDGVPDNPVGKPNLDDNWGNLVIVRHGPALFSMVCHLVPGSIEVREGQVVNQGDPLGRCGISGRADVPHIHFQLQGTDRVGAPTIRAELHDVVVEGERAELHGTLQPARGVAVRNIEPSAEMERLLGMEYGTTFVLALKDDHRVETTLVDLDLLGNRLLRARPTGAKLFYDSRDGLFVAYDTVGPRRSLLHVVQAALNRVPLEMNESLSWRDHLPFRFGVPWYLRPLMDIVSPFAPWPGLAIRYRARRDGRRTIVEGESEAMHRGAPVVRTCAQLEDGKGLVEATLSVRGRARVVQRIEGEIEDDRRNASAALRGAEAR